MALEPRTRSVTGPTQHTEPRVPLEPRVCTHPITVTGEESGRLRGAERCPAVPDHAGPCGAVVFVLLLSRDTQRKGSKLVGGDWLLHVV